MSQGKKLVLRKQRPQSDTIQKNLQPLKENIKKKMLAQQIYYDRQITGASPLRIRRQPVHQRLGQNKRFQMPKGTNTSNVLPKWRNNNKRLKINSAQYRINKIRQQQRESLQDGINNKAKKIFKLRRNLQKTPQNLTVQVPNNVPSISGMSSQIPRFKQILNHQLQQEILDIQNANPSTGNLVVTNMPVIPDCTKVSLHNRFFTY